MVNKGSNINVKDNHGNTPLIIACFFNNDKIIKLLVEKGANIDVTNKKNHSPLSIEF